jgi:alginate production protein
MRTTAMPQQESCRFQGLAIAGALSGCTLFAAPNVQATDLSDAISLKTELTFETRSQRNFDLDKSVADGFMFAKPGVDFELSVEPAEGFTTVLEVEASLRAVIEDDSMDKNGENELGVAQAYLQFEPNGTDLTLTAGRQDIDDETEWLIDDTLDGLRATLDAKPVGFDVYVGRKSLVNLYTPDEEEERVTNYAGFVRYKFNDKSYADAFAFLRDGDKFVDNDKVKEQDLLYVGIQSLGEAGQLKYWLNAAYLTGNTRKGNERADISAFGADIGTTYVFDTTLQPSVTLGFAYGSGDDDSGDSTDKTFRQTGLHDNDHSFNGVAGFNRFGLALEPELGNLMILTVGLGIKPTEKSSVDLVYHYYGQALAADELVDSNLDLDPSGDSKDIGHGLDLVIGYEEIKNLSIEADFSAFYPGKAFPDSSSVAFFGGIELTYSF